MTQFFWQYWPNNYLNTSQQQVDTNKYWVEIFGNTYKKIFLTRIVRMKSLFFILPNQVIPCPNYTLSSISVILPIITWALWNNVCTVKFKLRIPVTHRNPTKCIVLKLNTKFPFSPVLVVSFFALMRLIYS